jgi:arylsulfatase A-like enzyme
MTGILTACALLLLAAGGCSPRAAERPNVVLITIDTLRSDRLSVYGYSRIDTDAIAELARQGIVFEQAYTDTTWTLPAVSSLLTGKYPNRHHVRTWSDRLGDDHETLAEILGRNGYHTAAIVGSYPLDHRFGLDQGFAFYDDEMTTSLVRGNRGKEPEEWLFDRSRGGRATYLMARERSSGYRPDDQVADRAISWLQRNPDTPFFLWLHFFGPHEKQKRPTLPRDTRGLDQEESVSKSQWTAERIAAYDPDVENMARHVGRVLDALRRDRRWNDTAVLFHSDHGQSLDDHGLFGHGFDLFEPTARIPLIVRLPGDRRAGERVSRAVRNLDLFSTILALAGSEVAREEGLPSVNLLAEPAGDAPVYLESYHTTKLTTRELTLEGDTVRVGRVLRGVRLGSWKLVKWDWVVIDPERYLAPVSPQLPDAEPSFGLYNLAEDPKEQENVADRHPAKLAELQALLDDYARDETPRRPPPWISEAELDEAAKERLRSIGYLVD